MKIHLHAFVHARLRGKTATRPLVRLATRLPLSRLTCLLPRCFAPDTRLNAPSGVSNCGFQDHAV
jgi:hypothetical protein